MLPGCRTTLEILPKQAGTNKGKEPIEILQATCSTPVPPQLSRLLSLTIGISAENSHSTTTEGKTQRQNSPDDSQPNSDRDEKPEAMDRRTDKLTDIDGYTTGDRGGSGSSKPTKSLLTKKIAIAKLDLVFPEVHDHHDFSTFPHHVYLYPDFQNKTTKANVKVRMCLPTVG